MFKVVILLSALGCALGASIPEGMLPQLDGRIVGGEEAQITNYAWQVSLQRNGRHSCGGAILNHRVIVTAAHCLQGNISPSSLTIRVKSDYSNTGGEVIAVSSYKNHEGYNAKTMINDIALIGLKTSILMDRLARPIAIAETTPENGEEAFVTGWGTTSSGGAASKVLRVVDVNIVGRSECSSGAYSYGSEIKSSMICAAASGKDACQGDSGGPLVTEHPYSRLVGVVSWGYGCAQAKYPGVYADVVALRPWVLENTNNV